MRQVHPKAFYEATSKVITALDSFKPNLILVSAGFDAHQVHYYSGWKGMEFPKPLMRMIVCKSGLIRTP